MASHSLRIETAVALLPDNQTMNQKPKPAHRSSVILQGGQPVTLQLCDRSTYFDHN